MSKVRAHRHVTSAKLAALGGLIASLSVSGCSARATGDEDVVAISHDKPSSSHPRSSSSGNSETLSTVRGNADPFVEPSDRAAAGSGGSSGSSKSADAGSGTPDAGTTESGKGALGDPTLGGARDVPRKTVLFWVDAVGSRMWRANAEGDGSDRQLLAGALSIASPDGITVDLTDNFIYWTNMGTLAGGAAGSLQRMKIGGAEAVETVIPVGTTSTPKQINIDNQARKLYWSDREAMVWRSELNGSAPEVILSGHDLMQPAGLALDVARRQVYISDRIGRRLYRVGFDMPEGATAENRTDVETLAVFAAPAWPLNISLDLDKRTMYWTDRSRGTIYSMSMDMPAGIKPEDRTDIETITSGLNEPVGLTYDEVTKRLYFTELSGRVSRCNMNQCTPEVILTTASASGIALAHLPQ